MEKKLRAIILTVIILLSLFGFTNAEKIIGSTVFLFLAAFGDDSEEKQDIISFVTENQNELLSCIERNDYTLLEKHQLIHRVEPPKNVVMFACGSAGVGSGASYVGFFYTPDNDMTAIRYAPTSADSLIASGNGFEWREKNGDNRYYTEKICEFFYYYEASF